MEQLSILLRPGNPFDYTDLELGELASELESLDPSASVTVAHRLERGYGVTVVEVLALIVIAGNAVTALKETAGYVKHAVAWAQKRWQKDLADHPGAVPRLRVVQVIYGPDGSVIREIEIDMPDGEPHDKSRPEN